MLVLDVVESSCCRNNSTRSVATAAIHQRIEKHKSECLLHLRFQTSDRNLKVTETNRIYNRDRSAQEDKRLSGRGNHVAGANSDRGQKL